MLVDFTKGEQNAPEHLEELHPDPPMIGSDPLSRARTREAERDIEFAVMLRIIRYVHAHKSPLGLPPNPAVAEQRAQPAEVSWLSLCKECACVEVAYPA